MKIVVRAGGAAVIWLAHAVGVARLMSGRGFHPLPRFAVSMMLGPAMWPFAQPDIVSRRPRPLLLRKGNGGAKALIGLFDENGTGLFRGAEERIFRCSDATP